ncbi:hypothetical protein CWO08_11510 [Vibrio sp. 10N.286.48.B8]|nr:hypothetical protein CWO08_11510 [Vibrio sp. 10N.286.48.B8]
MYSGVGALKHLQVDPYTVIAVAMKIMKKFNRFYDKSRMKWGMVKKRLFLYMKPFACTYPSGFVETIKQGMCVGVMS